MVNFFTFEAFHGKQNIGSTNIRVHQLIKYWPEASLYRYGDNPEVLIFQKVYLADDYRLPEHFKGIKILDICDPDWSEGVAIVETAHIMDAVTVPTEALADFIRQFHDNVHVVPDRFDISKLPPPKKHTKKAKTVVWFGYSHNSSTLKPAIDRLEKLDLNLIIIADDDPFPSRWGKRDAEDFYKYVKYNEDTIYEELQKADFAVLPYGHRPKDAFKSNNKDVKAKLAGLPVAKTADEVEYYMDPVNRQLWFDKEYDIIEDIKNKRLEGD
jgi:hypothetical protein